MAVLVDLVLFGALFAGVAVSFPEVLERSFFASFTGPDGPKDTCQIKTIQTFSG